MTPGCLWGRLRLLHSTSVVVLGGWFRQEPLAPFLSRGRSPLPSETPRSRVLGGSRGAPASGVLGEQLPSEEGSWGVLPPASGANAGVTRGQKMALGPVLSLLFLLFAQGTGLGWGRGSGDSGAPWGEPALSPLSHRALPTGCPHRVPPRWSHRAAGQGRLWVRSQKVEERGEKKKITPEVSGMGKFEIFVLPLLNAQGSRDSGVF